MWTIVYLAKDNKVLHTICELLDKNKIIYRTRCVSDNSPEDDVYYDILVPAAEVSAAHTLILDKEL